MLSRPRRAALLTGLAGFLLLACQPGTPVSQRLEALSGQYGIPIRAGDPSTFYVPPYEPRDAVLEGADMQPARTAALHAAIPGIEQALQAYPSGFVSAVADAIFVCGRLVLDGAEAGGTHGPAWIIIVADNDDSTAAIYRTALYGIHHELSSLIWRGSPQTVFQWGRLMPDDWTPASDNAAALSRAFTHEGDYARGFLSSYAETSMENDFNTYAEMAFVEPARLSELARRESLVAKKLGLLIQAYASVAPEITKTFESLGLEEAAADPATETFRFNAQPPSPHIVTDEGQALNP